MDDGEVGIVCVALFEGEKVGLLALAFGVWRLASEKHCLFSPLSGRVGGQHDPVALFFFRKGVLFASVFFFRAGGGRWWWRRRLCGCTAKAPR